MNKIKTIRNLIIICIVAIVILIIAINVMNNSKNNNEIEQDDLEYLYEDMTSKERYEYNEFKYYDISTEKLLTIYFNNYINYCLGNRQKAFELLDKEYRTKKFGSYEAFNQYLEAKGETLKTAELDKFTINNYENYKEYILEDQFGNKYIFNVTAVMEYTVMFDDYTINTDGFIEKYNELSDEDKVLANLNRYITALNENDYKYAYSKLYSTFKENNFKTQAEFETYMNQNPIDKGTIMTVETENQNGVYICKLNVIGEGYENIEKTFMVQLTNEADYMISFTI